MVPQFGRARLKDGTNNASAKITMGVLDRFGLTSRVARDDEDEPSTLVKPEDLLVMETPPSQEFGRGARTPAIVFGAVGGCGGHRIERCVKLVR